MKLNGRVNVYISLTIAMFFWGMSFIWYKQAYLNFRPVIVILLRLFISSPFLLISSLLLNRLKWPLIRDIKYFLLLALFEPFFYFVGESYGMLYVSSTLASIIIALIPLITPFAGYYFYKERLTSNNYLGILISFLGVLIVIYIDGRAGEAPWFGIILLVMAVLSTLGYTVLLKRLSERYNALSIVWFQNLIGGIYFIPLFLLTETRSIVWKGLTINDFMPVIYLAIFASSFAFLFFIQGVKKLGITKSVVFTNFIPIVTAAFAVIILHEKLPLLKIAGILVTISGLIMSQTTKFPKIRRTHRAR